MSTIIRRNLDTTSLVLTRNIAESRRKAYQILSKKGEHLGNVTATNNRQAIRTWMKQNESAHKRRKVPPTVKDFRAKYIGTGSALDPVLPPRN